MDIAKVRDHTTGNYCFGGNPVPFVRLPVPGDKIGSPSTGLVTVIAVVHMWIGNTPMAEVHVIATAEAGARGMDHSDPR